MELLNLAKQNTNHVLRNTEPWKIVTITASTVLFSTWLWNFIFKEDDDIISRCKKTVFRIIKAVPSVRKKLDSEIYKIQKGFEQDIALRIKDQKTFSNLPEVGLTENEIINIVNEHLDIGSYDWKNGRVSGAVYYYDEKLINLVTKVYGITSYTNPLHPDIFPGINKMEAEVVQMTARLFNGSPNTCGSMTTGGTESILLACKAYRDYAREVRGIVKPEMIVATTAHSAFDKAAQFLKIRKRTIPVDKETFTVNIKAMKRAINSNTIMLVGSAPNYPYGTMDNIQEIAKLGLKYNIPVHVDACLGGFVIALANKVGYSIPDFDFRVAGVTSISADPHKYGFAPKGSSIILYSDIKFRHHQFTVTTDWPGGVYGSPTVAGSRAGGIIAACWATLLYFGESGYLAATKSILDTTSYIEQELRKLKGIFIFGTPATSVVAIGSNDFNIYLLSDRMSKKGWNLNSLQFPNGVHIGVTHLHTKPGVAKQFVDDITSEITDIMKNPQIPVDGMYAVYGTAQAIPDRSIVGDFIRYFIDSTYYVPSEKKEENGEILNEK